MRRLLGPRRGQALVETALVLPIFLFLAMGAVDAARAIWEYNTVAFLARDGARYGTVQTHLDVEDHVRDRCEAMLSDPCPAEPTFEVTPAWSACGSGNVRLSVTVRKEFEPMTFMVARVWGGGSLEFEARSQMYVEGSPVRQARNPGSGDSGYAVGASWLNTATNAQFQLTRVDPVSHAATWTQLASGGCAAT